MDTNIIIPEELSVKEIRELSQPIAEYLPYCVEQRDFHMSPVQYRWLFGGNQSGKTYANMMDAALCAMDLHPAREPIVDGVHWIGIESWEQVRDILWDVYLSNFIPKWMIGDIWYGPDRVPRTLMLKNGHMIQFKAFNQGRSLFQGRRIHSFHGDEQCLHDFKGIFSEIQARLMAFSGFCSWSMTPIIPQIELEERIEDLPSTDGTFYLELERNRQSQGGYLPDDRVNSLIADWAEEVQAPRAHGRFASYYGAVYKSFSRGVHVVPPFPIPDDWTLYRGLDFGFTNPFVCLWIAKDKDENFYVYREYYKAQTGIQEHITTVKSLSDNEHYQTTYADPEDAEARSDMRKAGIPTVSANKDVARGIETIQSKLKLKTNGKPSLQVFSNCVNTCREFSVYHYPTSSKSEKSPADKPVSKDDHALDALRYVLHTAIKSRKGSASLV
jgi:hypothetical protein